MSNKSFSVKGLLKLPVFIMILFLALIIACDGGGSGDGGGDSDRITNPTDGVQNPPSVNFAPSSGATWTIMVYLDGDNDLESYALTDFEEMKTGMAALGALPGDPSQFIKLIVMIDRISGYSASVLEGASFTDTRYYMITKTGATRLDDGGAGAGHVANLGEKNMGDPATLTAFINYCRTNHSADHYALILWNHGGGARSAQIEEPVTIKRSAVTRSGDIFNVKSLPESDTKAICWDESDGNDCLYLDEVQQAVDNSTIAKLDILGFDACLMGTIEVAYEFRNLADYMVGSMNTEWGNGWDYNRLFSGMSGNSSDASELAKLMVKQYRDSTSAVSSETQSAVDLSKITALKTAVDAFAVKLAAENKKSAIESSRDSSYNFYSNDEDSIRYPYYDLGDLAYQVSADTDYSADLRTSADAVITKISDAIISAYGNRSFGNYYGTGAEVKRGLSIFFSRDDITYEGNFPYYHQEWYSNLTMSDYYANFPYGKIDFCTTGSNPGVVENWKELMEYFYDQGNTLTNDVY